jgi:geranylgeranyl pyrophosphate synthase
MAGGQVLDLSAINRKLSREQLNHMHRLKKGALIKVSATAAAEFAGAGAELTAKLEVYGDCVGLAFQIHDDILDVTGCEEKTGKSTQKDAHQNKPTFPGILGLDESRNQATLLRDRALAELAGFPGDCTALAKLARFAVDRDN